MYVCIIFIYTYQYTTNWDYWWQPLACLHCRYYSESTSSGGSNIHTARSRLSESQETQEIVIPEAGQLWHADTSLSNASSSKQNEPLTVLQDCHPGDTFVVEAAKWWFFVARCPFCHFLYNLFETTLFGGGSKRAVKIVKYLLQGFQSLLCSSTVFSTLRHKASQLLHQTAPKCSGLSVLGPA